MKRTWITELLHSIVMFFVTQVRTSSVVMISLIANNILNVEVSTPRTLRTKTDIEISETSYSANYMSSTKQLCERKGFVITDR